MNWNTSIPWKWPDLIFRVNRYIDPWFPKKFPIKIGLSWYQRKADNMLILSLLRFKISILTYKEVISLYCYLKKAKFSVFWKLWGNLKVYEKLLDNKEVSICYELLNENKKIKIGSIETKMQLILRNRWRPSWPLIWCSIRIFKWLSIWKAFFWYYLLTQEVAYSNQKVQHFVVISYVPDVLLISEPDDMSIL